MPTRAIVLAVLALALPPTAVRADDPGLRRQQLDHCQRLVWQFDNAIQRPPERSQIDRARRSRETGQRRCLSGDPSGVLSLEAALIDIGVRPLPRP